MSQTWQDRGPRRFPKAIFALRSDPRFSWCMHVPDGYADAPQDYRLVVAVHGSSRGIQKFRDGFAAHADRHKWVVLLPLFPVGVLGDGNPDGYKMLIEGDLRYDRLLLAMVEEIGEALDTRFDNFGLFGFSGGAQFAHRFLYAHPARLWGVSVGAPGVVTRIDDRFDIWFGTRNWQDVFGAPLDFDAIRQVPIQLLCGDRDTADVPIPPAIAAKVSAMGDLGRNRVERMELLLGNFRDHAFAVRLDLVPGVAHEGVRCIPTAAHFLCSLPIETGNLS